MAARRPLRLMYRYIPLYVNLVLNYIGICTDFSGVMSAVACIYKCVMSPAMAQDDVGYKSIVAPSMSYLSRATVAYTWMLDVASEARPDADCTHSEN